MSCNRKESAQLQPLTSLQVSGDGTLQCPDYVGNNMFCSFGETYLLWAHSKLSLAFPDISIKACGSDPYSV